MEPQTKVDEIQKALDREVRVEIEVVGRTIHVSQPVVEIHRRGLEEPPPQLPRQVTWAAGGLGPDQRLRIAPKPGSSKDVFDLPCFELRRDDKEKRSGRAKKSAGDPHDLVWSYEVVLLGSDGGEQARLDPNVIIKDYP